MPLGMLGHKVGMTQIFDKSGDVIPVTVLQVGPCIVTQIKTVLTDSINNGGTTLNDFSNVDGNPGYFSQVLNVYGRDNMPCIICSGKIRRIIQNQRATYYCPKCQH